MHASLTAPAQGPLSPACLSIYKLEDMPPPYFQVRPGGWVRRVLWAAALMAMAGSLFSMLLLWVVVGLTSTSKTQPKSTGKEAPLSDGDVSSEDGASDAATGIPSCLDLQHGLACAYAIDAQSSSEDFWGFLLPLEAVQGSEVLMCDCACTPVQEIWRT